jgi:AbrB family looped-hinge helix DNA binding protein
MDIVKLGKKGQLSLPAGVLRKLGLEGAATLIVEATDDGAVVLRPAAVYPIELYSDARVKEFEQANRLTAAESARIAEAIKRPKAIKRRKA